MSAIKIVITVVFILVCLALVYLVFKGKGQGADLSGGITGGNATDTYYSTHGKKHSEDAMLEKATVGFIVAFIVLSLLLNMNW